MTSDLLLVPQGAPIHVADRLRQSDVAAFVIGQSTQIADHGSGLPGNGPEPELQAQPSALDAAKAAGIIVSHDNYRGCLPWR
jgi:hypothetical protein